MPNVRIKTPLAITAALLAAVVSSLAAAAPFAPAPRGSILVSSTRAPDLHDEIWLVDLRSGRRTNVSRDPAADRYPALSPDGRTLAFVSDRGGAEALWRSRPDGGGLRRIVGPFTERANESVRLLEPSWSPDGRRLAYRIERSAGAALRTEVRIVGPDGGASTRIAADAQSVHWSPDSRRLAISTLDAQDLWTTVHDLSGRRIWRRPGSLAGWSARGELALVVPLRKSIAIVGPDGSARRTVAGMVALWSPDGRKLATGDGRSLRILDERGRRTFSSTTYVIISESSWSPDGRALLVFDRAYRPFRLDLSGSSPAARRLPSGGGVWRPDGTLATLNALGISVGGRTVRLQTGGIGLCYARGFRDLRWLDRNRLIYSTGGRGQQMGDLWIIAGKQALRLGGTAGGWRGKPVWSPDGSRVAYEHGTAHTHAEGCSGPYAPHLRVADAGGGGVRLLTRPDTVYTTFDTDPRWSPGGGHVAFARTNVAGEPSRQGIFVVDVATGAEQRLASAGGLPTWTADGLSIVYEQDGDVRRVQVADGSIATIATGALPEAAPKGQLVAFLRGAALWSVRADGTGARRLGTVQRTARLEFDPPRWSPAADRVAVTDAKGVLVFDLGGGTNRIPAPGAAGVAWSPDGRTISFNAPVGKYSRGVNSYVERTELFTASAGGGKPTRVTTDLASILGSAAWRP